MVVGRDSSVGITTCYGLEDPAIESRCRRDFPHPSRTALGPSSLLYNGYRVFPGGKEAGVSYFSFYQIVVIKIIIYHF